MGETICFSNFADNGVYVQPGAPPRARSRPTVCSATPTAIDARDGRLISVREDHVGAGEAINTIVGVGRAGDGGDALVAGNDFYANPRVSPDGRGWPG